MAKNKRKQNDTYEFFTLDRRNVNDILKKIDNYRRKNWDK